jgi:prolyl oligopeptidase
MTCAIALSAEPLPSGEPPMPVPSPAADADPHLWLEEVLGDKPLAWVRTRNEQTIERLATTPAFTTLEADLQTILDDDQRIPTVTRRGNFLYNFWRDKDHPRGLWRRTTLEEYRKAEPNWELLLDLDALGADEGENWVWAGAQVLRPTYTRALVLLSRGGADARVVREFDLEARAFVDDGFFVPEAKGSVSWIDEDHIFVASEFGPGSMTDSGYPRTARLWKRGTALKAATVIFEGRSDDMSVSAFHDDSPGYERDYVRRARSFYADELFVRETDGRLRKIEVPDSASKGIFRGLLSLELREPWQHGDTSYAAGTLLLADLESFLESDESASSHGQRPVAVAFEPDHRQALAATTFTKNALALTILADVKNRVEVIDLTGCDAGTVAERIARIRSRCQQTAPFTAGPEIGTVSLQAVDADESDEVFVTATGFLEPTTLALGSLATPAAAAERLKELPSFFDTKGLAVQQHFATSEDGTRVPYFLVGPEEKLAASASGSAAGSPTVLYAYGGFEISLVPRYDPLVGKAWLEQGGVYAIANIRGGGEYGPRWHQAALKQNRLRAYEDCAAVARDLIAKGITSPDRLAVKGGSNGGLLVGNMLTSYPELFAATVCQVPLLDMQRYSQLLAGASWMQEYGNPDKPDEWAFLKTFSPYHKVEAPAANRPPYPITLLLTSTRDDRVHPGHARKMMAKLEAQGHPALYYENIEGGHGGAATNKQQAFMQSLAWTFLASQLGLSID